MIVLHGDSCTVLSTPDHAGSAFGFCSTKQPQHRNCLQMTSDPPAASFLLVNVCEMKAVRISKVQALYLYSQSFVMRVMRVACNSKMATWSLFKPCKGGLSRSSLFHFVGLRPGTEYGIGVTAMKRERESLPATTNAATGELHHRCLEQANYCRSCQETHIY